MTEKKSLLMVLATALIIGAPVLSLEAEQPSQRFLFIGNSFTMRHELPTLFATLAQEGNPETKVTTATLGYGGRNLFQHWECYHSYNRLNLSGRSESDLKKDIEELTRLAESEGAPAFYTAFWKELGDNAFYAKYVYKTKNDWPADRKLIKNAIARNNDWLARRPTAPTNEFDFVVLQSWLDVADDFGRGYFKYAAKFAEAAKASGARPVLYLTAPYAHNQTPMTNAVAREQAVGECKAALAFAKTINAIVVPVPLAITLAQESGEPVARTLTFRYVNDMHPNNTMAYLTACTFYAAVYGKSPEGLRFNKATENKAQNIHGEAVGKNSKQVISSLTNPDGGPLETVFSDEERLFLQRTAWAAVEALRKGEF